jgi:uncharacterized LabA/DUF88 family protein
MNYTFRYNCQHRVFSNSDLPKRSKLTHIPKSTELYHKFMKVNFESQRSKIKTCEHYQINESGNDEFWYSDEYEYSELFETYNGNL